MFTQVMDLSTVLQGSTSKTSLFKQHLTGIMGSTLSPVDFLRDFFVYMYQEDFFWEAQETHIDHKVLGTSIYGWNIVVDGHHTGFTGYLQKYSNMKIDDILVFDINLNFLIEQNKVALSNCLDTDFSNYLINHSSKRVLFELFDNYLEEGIFCIKKGLAESGYTFLMYCYNIYQLLIIRGFISKTERIGYDRKISGLIQKCVIG